jgi:hypothetical protein
MSRFAKLISLDTVLLFARTHGLNRPTAASAFTIVMENLVADIFLQEDEN